MKESYVVKAIPKSEEQQMTYSENGKPKYKVTRVIKSEAYKLYQCLENGFLPLKTRRNDPLFPEVM